MKIRKWFKRLLVGGVVLVLLGYLSLEVLLSISKKNGVEAVPLPAKSQIVTMTAGNNYQDAYRLVIDDSLFTKIISEKQTMVGGKVVFESSNESS